MRQKLYAGLLTLCMLVTLLPAGVWATEADDTLLPSGRTYSMKLTYPVEDNAVSANFADLAEVNAVDSIDAENTPALLADGEYATWEEAGYAAVEGVDYTMSDDNVFTVYTPLGLALVANYVDTLYTSFIGWTVKLGNDIDLATAGVIGYGKDTVNETNSWDPIGEFEYDFSSDNVTVTPFQGIFDGAGHKVQNLYMNASLSSTGLFSCVFTDMTRGGAQVVIKDVTIEGADITGNFMANSFLVGFLSEAIITDCTVDETSTLTIPGDTVQMNGGFVGGAQTSGLNLGGELYIENCINNGTISGGMCTGGIAGATGQKLLNCTNNGSVSANMIAGGIVGYYQEEGGIAPFEILDCVNNGSVSSANGWAGGIAGEVDVSSETSLIAYCYNTGSILGGSEAGGIAGSIDNGEMADCYNTGEVSAHEADSSDLGGIAGYLTSGSIKNCYNTGTIVNGAANSSGGIVGRNSGDVENCFYLEDTAQTDGGGSASISQQQLATQSTFTTANWDFETVWGMSGLLERPVLNTIPEAKGSGTQDDPIEIPDLATLERFRDSVNNGNSYEGMYVKLTADIDLNPGFTFDENGYSGGEGTPKQWTPIGNVSNKFMGTFDGDNHTISGLYISGSDNEQGLFRALGRDDDRNKGTIKNLSVSGSVTGGSYIGGLTGRNYGLIENCQTDVSVSGTLQCIGGLAGMNLGTISKSTNSGTISATMSIGGIGGVAGFNSNNSRIENCYNKGTISNENDISIYTGGIVGSNTGGLVSGCENEGAVTGTSFTGGIAGHIVSGNQGQISATIDNSSNTGTISGTNGIGGIIGTIGDAASEVTGCYNSGSVSSTANGSAAGGIAGYNNGVLTNCQNESADGSSVSSAADGARVGGIAGGNSYILQNSYNTGTVSATGANGSSGGVAGANYANGTTGTQGSVNHCYNTGTVSGGITGGVVGENQDEATATNCYYNNEIYTVEDTTEGVTGKTAAQFASGEVAYLLQNGQTDDGTGTIPQVWGQTLSGETPDTTPVLTDETAKIVYQVQFMANDAVYSAAFANPNGTVALPEEPASTVYDFMRWSQTNSADGDEFTAQTPVTDNMTVYAIGQEMYGQTDTEKTINMTYGTGATQNLSDYMTYAGETDAAGKFTYTITGGNTSTATENGNTIAATIDGDTLTIPADTNADTYTLTIQATEKQSVITPFSVSYGTQPVTLTVTIVVGMAIPDYTVPENLTAVYGQTLANITLPTGFTWQDTANTSVGDFGTNTFLVTFTPTNTSNYQTITDIEVTIAVTKAKPTVTLNVQNPQGVGENRSIDLAATVTGVTGGEVPTGTVEFFNGTESLGTATVSEGTATYTWNNVPVGDHSLRAVYSGSDNYSTAEGTVIHNIDKDPQNELTIGGLPETVVYGGEPFTLTVTGGSGTGALTYAVTSGDSVSVDADGNVTIHKPGESVITVTKAADDNYNQTTATVTINVAQASPTIDTPPIAGRVRLGNLLSTSTLKGGVVTGLDGAVLEGDWHWKDDREMTQSGTYQETVVFTPNDTNYAPVETTTSVDVYTSTINNGGGGSAIIRYTVTFDTQGGSRISSQTVSRNSTVSEPSEPTKDGYTFDGWYTDEECTEAYDFSSGVTRNLTLYAKWTEDSTSPSEPTATPEPQDPEEWTNPYADVTEGDWFYDAVQYADQNSLFNGISETEFAPNTAITRGMLVTVLHRAEGVPGVDCIMTFTDIAQNAYYTEAIRWAASAGIVKGYSETEFAPDRLISREEMAAIMNRYATYKGIDTSAKGDLTQFTDADQIADWARGNMEWAVGYGLLSGKDNNQLDPQGNTTRAEAAAILQRFFEK